VAEGERGKDGADFKHKLATAAITNSTAEGKQLPFARKETIQSNGARMGVDVTWDSGVRTLEINKFNRSNLG